MDDFLQRLAPRPSDYGGLPGKITREDDAGNVYDETGRKIFNKFDQTEQPDSWLDTAISTATAPAKLATALVGSLNPYGQDGWQVPPIISEPAAAFARSGESTGFGEDGQFYLPNVQNPQVAQDTLTQLMTVYGGNALNPLARVPKGSVGVAAKAAPRAPTQQIPSTAYVPKDGGPRLVNRYGDGFEFVPIEEHRSTIIDRAMDAMDSYNEARYMGEPLRNSISSAWSTLTKVPEYTPFQQSMIDAGGYTPFYYDIVDDAGRRLGEARGSVVGDTMNFDFLGGIVDNRWEDAGANLLRSNELGLKGIRQLREQVRQDFPNVTNFVGERVSGARDANNAANKMQAVRLLSDNRPSLMGSALASMQDNALPMDQASRLQRAAQQGYSPLYHATQATQPFDAFELGRQTFNSDVMGNPQATSRNAVFASPDVGFVNHFADDEMAVMPLMARLGNVFDATGGYGSLGDDFYSRHGLNQDVFSSLGRRDAWQAFDGPDGKAFADALKKDGYNAVRMQEELTNGLTPEKVHSAIGGFFLERASGDVMEAVNLARAEMMLAAPKHAKTYEKVIAELTNPTKPKVAETFAILDPSNIRSANAAFDPSRAGENGLLLSDNKPSLLGSALASGQGEEDLLTLLGYR